MRSVRVLRNVVTNYLRLFSAGVIGFLLTPIMVHGLGDGGYGLWVTIFSLTGYFGLIDQGIRPSLVRYVSRDHARGDREGLSRTLSSAILLYTGAGLVIFAATIGAAALCDRWFHIAPEHVATARAVVMLAGTSLAIGLPFGVFGATLSGLQRYDIANAIGIGIGVVRALAFVAVLRLHGGLLGLAWASLAVNVLGHLLSWSAVARLLPGLPVGQRFVDRAHLRLIGSYSGFAFVGALASSIAFQTDALVITTFLGATLVTPFALAAGLVENARWLVQAATFVLSPAASELDTLGEKDKLHAMVLAGSKYSVLVSWPVLLGLIVFGDNLIRTWVGARYATTAPLSAVLHAHGPSASAAQILILLAVPTLIALPQSSAASILYGVGRHRGVVALSILNALMNLALSILWVRPFGIAGVALGTALPLAVVSGLATLIYTCRALDLPLARFAWQGLIRPALAVLAFVLPALALQWKWRPLGWWPIGVACVSCWVLFAVIAWRFALADDERRRWGRIVPGLFRPVAALTGGVSS
ncbi:MAG TPA: polysaccharide biosynthesis C-terminal domain-containing protein [Candidatus Udaeobacter sp.]|jgi:O-antigen/teichoic acid export membrane protein|nr:polysaccharide biosynthesis C-terminal domain-containing protein [Candidatus Udaeobacter sp.]